MTLFVEELKACYTPWEKFKEQLEDAAYNLLPDELGQVGKRVTLDYVDFEKQVVDFDFVYDMHDYDINGYRSFRFSDLGLRET